MLLAFVMNYHYKGCDLAVYFQEGYRGLLDQERVGPAMRVIVLSIPIHINFKLNTYQFSFSSFVPFLHAHSLAKPH